MANVPTNAKQPQDRQSKGGESVPACFEFECDGETYTLAPTAERIKPGFVREMRTKSDIDVLFSALERVADAENLAVIDNTSFAENERILDAFGDYIEKFFGMSLGK